MNLVENNFPLDRAVFGIADDDAIEDYPLFLANKILPAPPDLSLGYFLVSTGAVWWDADGSGLESAVAITRFGVETPELTASNFEFA